MSTEALARFKERKPSRWNHPSLGQDMRDAILKIFGVNGECIF
jgi:hypothetical protein